MNAMVGAAGGSRNAGISAARQPQLPPSAAATSGRAIRLNWNLIGTLSFAASRRRLPAR